MSFQLTAKQQEANALLGGPQLHTLLDGGSRSGKTFIIMRGIIIRALAHESRHGVFRQRFSHLKSSIIFDTLPKMMGLCFPGVYERCHLNKSDWFLRLPNRSEVWFAGLDDKERTEKVLGQEFCIDPDSRVLTADLRWIRAVDTHVGMELIGFPEDIAGHLKLYGSFVTRSEVIKAHKFRVITDKGTTVVSANHQFVAHYDDRRHKNYRQFSWRKTTQLKVGDKVRWTCDPWDEGKSKEDGWFAGMLDGEGWCSKPARQVGVAQLAGTCLDALRDWFRANKVKYAEHASGGKKQYRPCYQLKASMWPGMRLLGIARPKRLDGRKLWEGVRAFRSAGHDATILSIEALGVGDVISLSTTTQTFIADGFLAHNSTLFLNECSQIALSSRNIALTRLAQKTPLRLRAWYDANPPSQAHWTNKLFYKKIDPETRTGLSNPDDYATLKMNPASNMANLTAEYIGILEGLPTKQKNRFLYGQYASDIEGALWTLEGLDVGRILDGDVPDLQRIIIAIDPSGCAGPEDTRSDEVGIIVGGIGVDGRAYIMEDLSGKFGPQRWGQIVIAAYDRWRADAIVAEINYGGAMVKEVIRAAASDAKMPMPSFKMVHASRGKVVRAEPVAALYGNEEKIGKVSHVGRFPLLEDQLCSFTTAGYSGERSPDRADALVWLISELFPALSRPERKPYTVPTDKNEAGAQGWMS